jgi:hypothetical protein
MLLARRPRSQELEYIFRVIIAREEGRGNRRVRALQAGNARRVVATLFPRCDAAACTRRTDADTNANEASCQTKSESWKNVERVSLSKSWARSGWLCRGM